jgi:hypothetical protein
MHRLQLDYGLTTARDHDVLALQGAVDQLGKLVFRFGNGMSAHKGKIAIAWPSVHGTWMRRGACSIWMPM